MKHNQHIIRGFIVLAVVLIVGAIIKAALIPSSFGQYGNYRADNLKEEMSYDPIYYENSYCLDCHDEDRADMPNGRHASVPCIDCHFMKTPHAEGDEWVSMPINRTREACAICHLSSPARPADFPQQKDLAQHIEDKWESIMGPLDKGAECVRCHKPHTPKIVKKGDLV